MTVKTYGELLFERYLNAHCIKFEYEPSLSVTSKLIDYVVEHPTHGQILFEIKDIHNPHPPGSFSQFDPYQPIRAHIVKGAEKFKDFPDALCALVLVAAPDSFIDLLNPHVMLSAMYGDFGWTIPFDPELGKADASQIESKFFVGKGKMVRPNQFLHTRIAALISLVDYYSIPKRYIKTDDCKTEAELKADLYEGHTNISQDKPPCITVWENGTAKRRLPQDIFRGDMDVWWTCDEEMQTPSFVGSRRLAL